MSKCGPKGPAKSEAAFMESSQKASKKHLKSSKKQPTKVLVVWGQAIFIISLQF